MITPMDRRAAISREGRERSGGWKQRLSGRAPQRGYGSPMMDLRASGGFAAGVRPWWC
ncbi:hypothetical protein L686_04300 [Stutzerimonas stutzeri MF28]|nr:hypothetical protein L686_04300 [Stutzerimonas stutzeri MF28]